MAISKKDPTSTDVRAEVDIRREGTAVTVPQGMKLEDAITFLKRRIEEEEQVVQVTEVVQAFPPDGAVALQRAIAQIYGWASMVPKPGFFGPQPPQMISVQVSPTETIKVPWGRMAIPGVEGYIETHSQETPNGHVFVLAAQVKQKHRRQVIDLADLTRKIVAERSIFKGRALRVDLSDADNVFETLRFLDLSTTKPEELVLPAGITDDVNACVFAPILHADACHSAGVQAKRGVLLLGPYGCGKTLIGKVAAKFAEEAGRTFLLLDDVRYLARAVDLAVRYAPAVIFAEDLDRAVGPDRNSEVDAILNTIDGIAHKDADILVVLTTNHVEQINKAMLRPGRLDSVITVMPPDPAAVMRLLRQYGRQVLEVADEDLAEIADMLDGQIPAVIREVAERAKLYAVAAGKQNGELHVEATELRAAAHSVLRQVALVSEAKADRPLTLDDAFRKLIGESAIGEHAGSELAAIRQTVQNEGLRARHAIAEVSGEAKKGAVGLEKAVKAVKADTEEILSNQ